MKNYMKKNCKYYYIYNQINQRIYKKSVCNSWKFSKLLEKKIPHILMFINLLLIYIDLKELYNLKPAFFCFLEF